MVEIHGFNQGSSLRGVIANSYLDFYIAAFPTTPFAQIVL